MNRLLKIASVVAIGIALIFVALRHYARNRERAQASTILNEASQIVAKDIYATTPARPLSGTDDIDHDGRPDFKYDPHHWWIRVGKDWVEVGMLKSDPKRGCRMLRRHEQFHFVNGEWIPKMEPLDDLTPSTSTNKSRASATGGAACKAAYARPYVQSGPDGVFYARCIPQDTAGSAGTTDIYMVEKEHDKLVDHYDWFTQNGVVLGWSPIAGKVAVMAVRREDSIALEKQVEFSFHLGGKLLKSWTTADLKKLVSEIYPDRPFGQRADFNVLGCEQIPNTNEYVFTIRLEFDKKLSFDILTGNPYHK